MSSYITLMDRPFAWIDLLAAIIICVVVSFLVVRKAPRGNGSVLDEIGIPLLSSFVIVMLSLLLFAFWGIISSLKPIACTLGLPNEISTRSVVISNGTASCEAGFILKEGRHSSLYCQKEIERKCE